MLKRIENVLNNHHFNCGLLRRTRQPLTNYYLDEILTQKHLIITIKKQHVNKRFIYTKRLLEHFKNRWNNKYLKELREHHYNRKTKYTLHPNVVDTVWLHDDTLKC